jgi:hypothetical protein
VSSNPTHDEVYSIQHYVKKFVGGYLWVVLFPPQQCHCNVLRWLCKQYHCNVLRWLYKQCHCNVLGWLCKQCHYQYKIVYLDVVSSNPTHDEVYSIQHYVKKFVGGYLWVVLFPPPIKLIATIHRTYLCHYQYKIVYLDWFFNIGDDQHHVIT